MDSGSSALRKRLQVVQAVFIACFVCGDDGEERVTTCEFIVEDRHARFASRRGSLDRRMPTGWGNFVGHGDHCIEISGSLVIIPLSFKIVKLF